MAIVCEMCESTDFAKQDGFFVCQKCGMKYSPEDAKKMMSDDTVAIGDIRTKNDTELENLYKVARRAREDGNDETAEKYYDMIQVKDPTSWEAAFYTVYFKSKQCKIAHIASAGVDLGNCQNTVMSLVKDYVKDEEQQIEAVRQVVFDSILLARMLFNGAINHYNGIDGQIRNNYTGEKNQNCAAAVIALYSCGNAIENNFKENKRIYDLAGDAWYAGFNMDKYTYTTLSGTYKEKMKACGVRHEKKLLEDELASLKFQESKIKPKSKVYGMIAWIVFTVFVKVWFMPLMEAVDFDFFGVTFFIIGIIGIIACFVGAVGAPEKKVQLNKKIEEKQKEIDALSEKEAE